MSEPLSAKRPKGMTAGYGTFKTMGIGQWNIAFNQAKGWLSSVATPLKER